MNKKEALILIAVCAFISLLMLTLFFLFTSTHKTEKESHITVKDKYTEVIPAGQDISGFSYGLVSLSVRERPEKTRYYLKTCKNTLVFKKDKNGNRTFPNKIPDKEICTYLVSKEIYDRYEIGDIFELDKERKSLNTSFDILLVSIERNEKYKKESEQP